jgi:hypothetical protein
MIKQQSYTVKKLPNGERIICLADGTQIHADIAGLAAGTDKWLSEIVCKCRDCKQPFPLRELNGGGQWCETCQTADIEEATTPNA